MSLTLYKRQEVNVSNILFTERLPCHSTGSPTKDNQKQSNHSFVSEQIETVSLYSNSQHKDPYTRKQSLLYGSTIMAQRITCIINRRLALFILEYQEAWCCRKYCLGYVCGRSKHKKDSKERLFFMT